jgi:hypothetical protein
MGNRRASWGVVLLFVLPGDQHALLPIFAAAALGYARGSARARTLPEVLESIRHQLGVVHRMLDVLVAEVRLQRPGVVALVGEGKAAGVPQHVRVRFDAEPDTGTLHQPGESCRGERRATFGREHECRLGFLLAL